MVVIFVGLLCWGLRYFLYYSYSRKTTGQEFFVPARTLIVVFLLKYQDYQIAERVYQLRSVVMW